MKGTFYILDYARNLSQCTIDRKHGILITVCQENYLSGGDFNSMMIDTDGITTQYLIDTLKVSPRFRSNVIKRLKSINSHVLLKVLPPEKEIIDYAWNQRAMRLAAEQTEMENLMSVLSTLGGAFSALGDDFTDCAKLAGKISVDQLKLAHRLGDPFIIARCKLYYSISLIQMGKLKAAKGLIQEQYKFVKSHEEADTRLVRMCLGIWSKLRYAYEQRSQKIKNSNAAAVKQYYNKPLAVSN